MSIDILDDKFEINRWVRPVLELLPYLNSGNDYFLTLLMASFVGLFHWWEKLGVVCDCLCGVCAVGAVLCLWLAYSIQNK